MLWSAVTRHRFGLAIESCDKSQHSKWIDSVVKSLVPRLQRSYLCHV